MSLAFLSQMAPLALPLLGPAGVAAGGALSLASSFTGGGSPFGGGGAGVSPDDLESPNFKLSLDCKRFETDATLKRIYPAGMIKAYESLIPSASPTKALRLQNVANCLREREQAFASQGYKAVPTSEIVYSDSAGPQVGFELVPIGTPAPAQGNFNASLYQTVGIPNASIGTGSPTTIPNAPVQNFQTPTSPDNGTPRQQQAEKSNTGLWVGVGFGLLALVGVAVVLTKDKK